jgi:hypothetical protein
VIVNDLLKLAIEGHGGLRRWEQFTRSDFVTEEIASFA